MSHLYSDPAGYSEDRYELEMRHRDEDFADSERAREDAALEDWRRRTHSLDRPARPHPKPAKRVTRRAANQPTDRIRAWALAVQERDQGCVVHPNPADCDEGFQTHHVLPQQLLRRDYPREVWNPLVGVCVCGLAHRQFHAGGSIPRECLPLEVWMHCSALSPAFMARRYPARAAA